MTDDRPGCQEGTRKKTFRALWHASSDAPTDAQSHASQLREVRAYVRRRWPKAEVSEYL